MIKVSKSYVGALEKKYVNKVLDVGFLGMGNETIKFEKMLEIFFDRHVACVSSGTAALQLALQAHDIKKGDEVIVSTLTFVASFQAISALGAIPVPCDVDIEDLTITIEHIKKKINTKTKAIIPIHLGGHVGKLDEIYKFAKKNNLKVIEDAAHAFGTIYKNNKIGSYGDTICFSFDGIKNITSGEGGCVVSNNIDYINRIKSLRRLSLIPNNTKKKFYPFDVNEQGWRYHMSDIMAAIGIAQLNKFNKIKNIRQKLAKKYDSIFKKYPDLIKIYKRDYDLVVPHIYIIKIIKSCDINQIRKIMIKMGIETGLNYFPAHLFSFYKSKKNKLLVSDDYYKNNLTLPLHPSLKIQDINFISKTLVDILSAIS